jgi:multisubunit Na+/H+ antiporter MnhG subunit
VSGSDIAVDVLLAAAAVGEAVCCLGLLAARTALDKLHYAGASATLPPLLIAIAVIVEEGLTQPSLNAVTVAVLLLVPGAAISHYTALVARRREREGRP